MVVPIDPKSYQQNTNHNVPEFHHEKDKLIWYEHEYQDREYISNRIRIRAQYSAYC